MVEAGIKPIWVFDGIAPEQKRKELNRRKQLKLQNKELAIEAKEVGTAEDQLKHHIRSAKISPQMTEDAKTLLRLMGFPVITAPGEAEAQCVEMVKQGKASAVASDDMDCLTFGAEILLKGIKTKKDPVIEIRLDDVLKEMGLTMDQFIDMCILCGCDYCETIGGLGPVSAYKLISEHKTIENVIEFIKADNEERVLNGQKAKYMIPESEHFDFVNVRLLFKDPDVRKDIPKVEFEKPKEEEFKKFLVDDKNFDQKRVETILNKFKEAFNAKPQMTLESFFGRPQKTEGQVKSKTKADKGSKKKIKK